VGESLPPIVLEALDGRNLEEKIGPVFLLITTDVDGSPRPCMVSAGEVIAVDYARFRVALWPTSHTSANLSRGSSALFCFVAENAAFYIRGSSRVLGRSDSSGLEGFEIRVESVESDTHSGMPIREGITFSLDGVTATDVSERWAVQLAGLRDS
jgi:hypothetical protein